MIKIGKICLSMLFVVCDSYGMLGAVRYIRTPDSSTINIVSGAFLDMLKRDESIAYKRSVVAVRRSPVKVYEHEGKDLVQLTQAEWTYWQALVSIAEHDIPTVDDKILNMMLEAAKGGCSDARVAIAIACEALSYSDAISEGDYSVKECLKSRILRASSKYDLIKLRTRDEAESE